MSTTQWAKRQSHEELRSSILTLCLTRSTKSIQRRSEKYSWNGKHDLCLMWSKQKSYEDTFSPTPSLPMIRTLLEECCTTEWEVRHKNFGNAFCVTTLKGRSLYMWNHRVDYQVQQRIPFGSSKRQFMDWKTVTELFTTYWRKWSCHTPQRKK